MKSINPRLVIALLLVCLLPMAGCTTGSDPAVNARNAAGNQALLQESVKILGNVAVATLSNYASSEMTGQKQANLGDAAAAGLWSQVTSASTAASIGNIVSAYSGGTLPQTASAAQTVAAASIAKGNDPAAVGAAIANVISAEAAK